MKGALTATLVTMMTMVLGVLSTAVHARENSRHTAAGPSHTKGTAPAKCPVMPDNEIKREFHVDHEGRRIYFCCKFCVASFRKTPEKYLAGLPQFAPAAPDTRPAEHDGDAAGHEHPSDHHEPEGLARLVRFAGNFHSVVVHFPIALIVAAALAEILAFIFKSPFFGDASRFTIILGAVGAGFAAALGWAAGAFAGYPEDFSQTLTVHRWLGTSVAVLAILSALFSEWLYRGVSRTAVWRAYGVAMALSVALVGLTGYFGGVLIYGFGHYSW